jgi:diguanylate cyclase (GGDEF)-like protein
MHRKVGDKRVYTLRCRNPKNRIPDHKYMHTDPNAEVPKGTNPAKSLTEVLGQSEHAKDLVDECAEELSSVNVALKQELVYQDTLPGVENALAKNEAIEAKVQEASEELSVVNQGLEDEVAERHVLECRLAAATEEEKTVRHAALHDPLTGLPNRTLFDDRLKHGLAQAKRHGWALAVMFVDLDDFKNINDSYGHDIGDVVLQTIGGRLKENVRGDDTISRYGGDEFLYLLMAVRNEQDIMLIAEKIIKAIRAPCDVNVRGLSISLSINASIGISIFPKDGTTADTLMKSADEAMYRAKLNKSRNSFAA